MQIQSQIPQTSFAENPMILTVVTENDFPEEATIRICKLSVFIDNVEYPFARECENNETITFDVSSAFVAAIENPSPDNLVYEAASGTVRCQLMYLPAQSTDMVVIKEQLFSHDEGNIFRAIRGGVSQLDRRLRFRTQEDAVKKFSSDLSRKPATIETRNIGDTIYHSAYSQGKVTTSKTILMSEGQTTVNGRTYLVEDNPDRTEIIFLNSLGVYESASALSLHKQDYKITKEVMAKIPDTEYRTGRTSIAETTEQKPVLEMSSGYTTTEWLRYWLTEVMTTKEAYIKDNETGTLIPVTITPKDSTTTIYDKADPELRDCQFTLTIDLQGL